MSTQSMNEKFVEDIIKNATEEDAINILVKAITQRDEIIANLKQNRGVLKF